MSDLTNSAWITGGLSVLGGLINAGSNVSANKTNLQIAREYNQTQRDIAAFQAQYNERMWHSQNEYNTPSAQMERYKAAGLNPNLIYGQGSPGNASSSLTYPDVKQMAPSVRPVVQDGLNLDRAVNSVLTAQAMELDNKRRSMELEQVPYQTQLKQLEVFNESIRQNLLTQQHAKNAQQLKYLDDQLFYQTQAAQQTVKNLVAQGELYQQKYDLNDQANQRAWQAMSQRERKLTLERMTVMLKQELQNRLLPGQEYKLSQEIFKLEKQNSILEVQKKFEETLGKDNATFAMRFLNLLVQMAK